MPSAPMTRWSRSCSRSTALATGRSRRCERLTADRANVHLVTDVLSRQAVDSLMACSDAFVSLHRSEGFGLPIAEAMALGKPVIATGWSGNMDFMSEDTAACVGYEIVELERHVRSVRGRAALG